MIRCARGPEPAAKRIRWFVGGHSMPMLDVCEEHLEAEQRVAELLNRGRPSQQHRVRVSELPEQLVLRPFVCVRTLDPAPNLEDVRAALALYRSCRERDMRPWEALEWVRGQVLALASSNQLGFPGGGLLAIRCRRLLSYLDQRWLPIMHRWLQEAADDARRTAVYRNAPPLLDQLRDSVERAAGPNYMAELVKCGHCEQGMTRGELIVHVCPARAAAARRGGEFIDAYRKAAGADD